MITAPTLDEVTIVSPAPKNFDTCYDSERVLDVLMNEPHKRSYKSADLILLQSDILSFGLELDKIKKIYSKHRNLFTMDFQIFYAAYYKMSRIMSTIVPKHCRVFTEVSTEDECLSNYYEFDDRKIFFNLFFEENEKEPIALINVTSDGKFQSLEGSIENTVDRLRLILTKQRHV